eukprot:365063-Chlamydomonas_euryale.AAC.7
MPAAVSARIAGLGGGTAPAGRGVDEQRTPPSSSARTSCSVSTSGNATGPAALTGTPVTAQWLRCSCRHSSAGRPAARTRFAAGLRTRAHSACQGRRGSHFHASSSPRQTVGAPAACQCRRGQCRHAKGLPQQAVGGVDPRHASADEDDVVVQKVSPRRALGALAACQCRRGQCRHAKGLPQRAVGGVDPRHASADKDDVVVQKVSPRWAGRASSHTGRRKCGKCHTCQ